MKKIVSIMIIVIIVFSLGIYALIDHIFPKAGSIREIDMSESVNIYDSKNKEIIMNDTDLQKLVTYINNAESTRIMSINDYPSVRPYYVVEIKSAERIFRYVHNITRSSFWLLIADVLWICHLWMRFRESGQFYSCASLVRKVAMHLRMLFPEQ